MPPPARSFHLCADPSLGSCHCRLSSDARALKAAADRLAQLLNDLKVAGFGVESADRGWAVVPLPADEHGPACVLVDDPHGYWDATEIRLPTGGASPSVERSLADRLRALAAEVEAL